MDCKQACENIIALLANELDNDQASATRKHIAECPKCHKEMKSLEVTLSIVHNELAPVEAPADFSEKLLKKINTSNSKAPLPRRSASERHYQNLSLPLTKRLTEQAKRSPYFAVSILLHAAAAVIVIALLVRFGDKPEDKPRISQYSTTAKENYNKHEITLSLPSPAYTERSDRPAIVLTGQRLKTGVIKVNIAQFAAETVLTLVKDKELGCIKAYYKNTVEAGVTCKVKNSELDIPKEMANTLFAQDLRMRVIEMNDRLEIWPRDNWLRITPKIEQSTSFPTNNTASINAPSTILATSTKTKRRKCL